MNFVDELNSMRNAENQDKDITDVLCKNCISAIKNECKKNNTTKKIEGYFHIVLRHDGVDGEGISLQLPKKYTSREYNSSIGNRWSSVNLPYLSGTGKLGYYNHSNYGGYKYFFSETQIDANKFTINMNNEIKKLGFKDFRVTPIRTENECLVYSTRMLGGMNLKYEKTGEWGYLIYVKVQW